MRKSVLILLIATGLVILGWNVIAPRYPRSKLPATATEIHHYDSSGLISFQSDYFFLLTAKISEAEFGTFVDQIGFVEDKSNCQFEWWPGMNGFQWWTPGEKSDRIFVSKARLLPNAAAKYENGRLYYKESSGY